MKDNPNAHTHLIAQKQNVTYPPNGKIFSDKKERIWVSCSEVDEPRAYYIEWIKLKRGKQILYINTYIWNLEKQYWWTYLQRRNGDADVENGLVETAGEAEARTIAKVVISCIK